MRPTLNGLSGQVPICLRPWKLFACGSRPGLERGRQIFFEETFDGNREEAVATYNQEIFNQPETGSALAVGSGRPSGLSAQGVLDIGAVLRVIGAADNVRESRRQLQEAPGQGSAPRRRVRDAPCQAWFEAGDAMQILQAAHLHRRAVARWKTVLRDIQMASDSRLFWKGSVDKACSGLELAGLELMDETEAEPEASAGRF